MAGLTDWLDDILGGSGDSGNPMQPGPGAMAGGLDTMGSPTGQMSPMPTAAPASTGPLPPVQQTGDNSPPMVPPMGPITPDDQLSTAGPLPPGTPPVPLPAPRPAAADGSPLPPGTPPPVAPPTSLAPPAPGADPAAAIASYQKAGGNFMPLGQGVDGQGPIARALGMSPDMSARLSRGLADGLKAAGNSAGKSPFQAATSGAGATLGGMNKADDDKTKQQNDYLKTAAAAKTAGQTGDLNVARTQLALAQAKQAMTGGGKGGKDSVMNSNEQLYLRGLGAVNQDAKVKASAAQLKTVQANFGADSPQAKAALAAHNELIDQTKAGVFKTLGVDEKTAAKIGKQPGFSQDNPVPAKGLTKEAFDKLPVGAYFINPKDNQLLVKQPPAPEQGQAQPQADTSQPPLGDTRPAAPPPMPTNPTAAADDEE